ncbi:MAG: alpha/beta hydrolase [Armatimonadetes bacterium]|nr:alpha/beta hydrolase [Armatimonadota bacterium]
MPALMPTQTLTVRGLRLRYHVEGDGDPVILLHGFPETLQGWNGRLQALAKCFRVHAFDWPGMGGSDAPRDFSYTYEGYARLLEDVMDALGVGAAHLVGTDIGMPPALLLAIRRPGRVRKLVVFDGPAFERPALLSWEITALRTPWLGEVLVYGFPRSAVWLALERGFYGRRRISGDQYEDFQAQARRQRTRDATLELFRSGQSTFGAIEREIHQLTAPMLILWGEEDVFIAPEMGMLLKAACPHARLEIVPQCGHFLHQEVPRYFDQQVMAFLADADQ